MGKTRSKTKTRNSTKTGSSTNSARGTNTTKNNIAISAPNRLTGRYDGHAYILKCYKTAEAEAEAAKALASASADKGAFDDGPPYFTPSKLTSKKNLEDHDTCLMAGTEMCGFCKHQEDVTEKLARYEDLEEEGSLFIVNCGPARKMLLRALLESAEAVPSKRDVDTLVSFFEEAIKRDGEAQGGLEIEITAKLRR